MFWEHEPYNPGLSSHHYSCQRVRGIKRMLTMAFVSVLVAYEAH
jgi:hypothetical protein